MPSSHAPKSATCHPSRKAYSFGLCHACYRNQRYANDELFRERQKRAARKYRSKNANKCRATAKKRYEENGDAIRMAVRLARHGITQQFYDSMLERQNFACAICLTEFTLVTHIDHCHGTGIVRGILCHKCNNGIGWIEKNPSLVDRALNYISHQQQKTIQHA